MTSSNRHGRFFALTLFCLLVVYGMTPSSAATPVLVSLTHETVTTLDTSNGVIDALWDDVTNFSSIPEFGDGGRVKFSNNGTHLFSLLEAPRTNLWLSIQFNEVIDDSRYMLAGSDAWSFYIDQDSDTVTYEDQTFQGRDMPDVDNTELSFEATFTGSSVSIEAARPFDSGEAVDILFTIDSVVYLIFAAEDEVGLHKQTKPETFALQIVSELGAGPDVEEQFDWDSLKDTLFYVTGGAILIFVFVHLTVRQFLYPLTKWNRIVDANEFKDATFKERLNTLMSKEDK